MQEMEPKFIMKNLLVRKDKQNYGTALKLLNVEAISEKIGLFHDTHELLFSDLAITVSVGFVDHLLNLVVSHVLAELFGDSLQILEGNLAGLVVVEKTEGLQHLLARVALSHLLSHHVQELREVDVATV